ncbi:MAG TPA: hypothetical protein ENH57_01740 [Actinobacteria bacterium]|nr:hypothetical protein [Actinomycetota bacterium]
MKTQSLFNYAVVENIKSKDENGNIDSTKLKVHGSGTAMPAYDADNAEVKALALVKLPEKADIDEVRAIVTPFC